MLSCWSGTSGHLWTACQATVFAPFVFRYLLNRYIASEGLGEVGINMDKNVVLSESGKRRLESF